MNHGGAKGSRWKHWALMALCCAPMVALAALIILGLWTP